MTTTNIGNLECLLPPSWKTSITEWIREDTPSFDYGGYVVGDSDEVAVLYGKSKGKLAGVPFFNEVFNQCGCRVEWLLKEGDEFDPATTEKKRFEVARVYGKARSLLLGERVALNTISRCSGIATRATKLANLKEQHKWQGVVAGTRKTTPGFRLVEKYGMLVGGVDTHRVDLSSMIMLKDNHIWSQGSITAATKQAKKVGGFALKVEVECRTEEEAEEAITAGADIVMLDNFKPDDLKATARRLKEKFSNRTVLIEASGGISEDNIVEYFDNSVDVISLGSLSHGVPIIDFSLKIQPKH